MKKRMLAMSLAGVLAMSSLAGCGSDKVGQNANATDATTKATETTVTTEAKEESKGPITTDPITISIFTDMSDKEANVENLWYFKYLEYYMREKGYDLTIEVSTSESVSQQVSLMLGTDTLADLYIGPALKETQAVMYGSEDKIILDWAPYLNEETMPNTWELYQRDPSAVVNSTYHDGGIYALPYLCDRNEAEAVGDYTGNHAIYVNTKWLEQCKLTNPTNFDEFMNMLRTFKSEIKLESGEDVIPIVDAGGNRLARYLWASLGYYGENGTSGLGNVFSIKDGEVYLPAYTDDFDTYIEIMHTLYDEGLISKDWYTEDAVAKRGQIASGVAGVIGDWTMTTIVPDTFKDYVALKPITIGDNDEVYSHMSLAYRFGSIWASASTEYPEVLAEMVDWMNSPEGIVYYFYGPMQGQDPLNMLDGWYIGEDGRVTTKMVEDGTIGSMEAYAQRYVYPWQYGISRVDNVQLAYEMAGVEKEFETYEITDAVTGEPLTINATNNYSMEDANGYGRYVVMDEWEGHVTSVRLPQVMLTEEVSLEAKELETIIKDHITSESAKFVTGVRPLSEVPAFKEELKAMGVEEYIQIYKDAYAPYMDSIFK